MYLGYVSPFRSGVASCYVLATLDFDPNSPGYRRALNDLMDERDRLSQALAVVNERIKWMVDGQRLFGDDEASALNGGKPVLREAILQVMREGLEGKQWGPKDVLGVLETRGWAPQGKHKLQIVRERLRDLVTEGELEAGGAPRATRYWLKKKEEATLM